MIKNVKIVIKVDLQILSENYLPEKLRGNIQTVNKFAGAEGIRIFACQLLHNNIKKLSDA